MEQDLVDLKTFYRATNILSSKGITNKQTQDDEKNKEPYSFADLVGLLFPEFAYEGITVKQIFIIYPALPPTDLVTTPPILKNIIRN